LNIRGSLKVPLLPQLGQLISSSDAGGLPCFSAYASSRWSARNRLWQDAHSVSGSTNSSRWPEAAQTSLARMTAESMPTMSSRCWTIARHHCRRTFSFSSTPSGP
jgi:hypothetical protein